MSKLAKVTMSENRTVIEMMFRIIGRVTYHSRCHQLAPSIAAMRLREQADHNDALLREEHEVLMRMLRAERAARKARTSARLVTLLAIVLLEGLTFTAGTSLGYRPGDSVLTTVLSMVWSAAGLALVFGRRRRKS